MGVCLPNTVRSSVKSVIHKCEVCNQVAFNSHTVVLNNQDIRLTNNSLLQSNDENFVNKLALNYEKKNC